MISKEIRNVLNGEYINKQFDEYMGDVLFASMLTLDMSHYMRLRALREHIITDDYLNQYEHEQDGGLSL